MFFNDQKKIRNQRDFDAEVERLVEWVQESVSPFVNDTPKKQEARVRRAREDQDHFNSTYLPHYFTQPGADFHREMEELSEEGERQHRPVAVAAPRGHAKSTRISFARVLKKIVFKEKKFIAVVGEDETLAAGNTVSIRTELEYNVRLLHDFGAQRTRKWAEAEFITKGGTKVVARGAGQSLRGFKHGPYRWDLIVIDDPESDEMQKNSERVKALVARVNEEYSPSLDPDRGQLFWVGTLLSQKSALALIMENKEWISKIFKAVEDPVWSEEAVYSEEQGRWLGMFTAGIPLWAERWDLEKLSRERRRIGSPAFAKEYQNSPEDGDRMFHRAWIRRIPWNRLPEVALYPYGGRDPSLKNKTTSDFKANVCVARGGPLVYVRFASIKRISLDQMVKEDFFLVARFGLLQLGVELDGWQALLRPLYDKEAERQKRHLPIVPIERHGLSKDDVMRIGGMSPAVEGGVIIFCEGPVAEVGDMELLIDQTVGFQAGEPHDDGPDALEIAYHLGEKRAMSKPSYEQVAKREAQFGVGAW